MTSFIALYRGRTMDDARIVGVTADRRLVSEVAARMLDEADGSPADPVIRCIDEGRLRALRLIQEQVGA
jgi:hypothetical protein